MRSFSLSPIQSGRPTILLLNGGGQQPYNKFHKVSQLFKGYDCNIVSLELPGHGKSYFETAVSVEEMLADYTAELEEICQEFEEVGLFGYSLGGLLSLKATELGVDDFLFTIGTGATIRVTKEEEEVMQYYTTVKFFEKMRWMKIMKQYHKEGWETLLQSMTDMLVVGSDLFTNPQNLPEHIPVHLILGDSDEVADYRLHEDLDGPITLHILENTSHFEYFSSSWDQMKTCLTTTLDMYLDAKD